MMIGYSPTEVKCGNNRAKIWCKHEISYTIALLYTFVNWSFLKRLVLIDALKF